jgi:hypothetical protein
MLRPSHAHASKRIDQVYPHGRAAELAKANREPVYSTRYDLSPYGTKHMKSGDADAMKMKHSEVKSVQPDGNEEDIYKNVNSIESK